jgi:hypothetical protein
MLLPFRPSYKTQLSRLQEELRNPQRIDTQTPRELSHSEIQDMPRDGGSTEEEENQDGIFSSTFHSGSLSLQCDGSLIAQGVGASFFRMRTITSPVPVPPPFLNSHLFSPYLPFSISPQLHDTIFDLALTCMGNFGALYE